MVAELADALDSGSSECYTRGGSSPLHRTKQSYISFFERGDVPVACAMIMTILVIGLLLNRKDNDNKR